MNSSLGQIRFQKVMAKAWNILFLGVSLLNVFPIIWMFYSAFKTEKEYVQSVVAFPESLNFQNFIEAIRTGNLISGFANSAFASLISVTGIITIAFFSGYVISRFNFKGRNLFYTFFLSGMLIPVHALLVPVFMEFKSMNMLNNRFTLLLPYIAFGLPTALFLIENFIRQIPTEIEEAALIDGATFFQRLVQIVFPMCKPVISTVVVMAFLDCWNEFSFSLILVNDERLKTLQVRLAAFAGFRVVNYPRLMAALVIATLPVLIVYFVLNKKIIEGMTAGAVKG